MDLKATALLKLVYLEMFGHDMSWASFHVLEVMASSKYPQKRVGYLSAVQSFRPDTEVLMLATNLLQKDLSSAHQPTISLPLGAIPHIITHSLAQSLLSDLLPRLTHSQPVIRKKTIVTLYRLALVYPETLRLAWPKIKERLMDENEDSSVTAAIINVVCELGWRRPHDFLSLAPRLFDLLVKGGNNWMAIKIIKLFATLTPLEPRLIRKLLPPLTSIIRTTPAMSLLYECINGIIQGGILESAEGTNEGEDIATLCVGKLRGMIGVEEDPNLKYVALLAFNKIVVSHPHLVASHQDVILNCIDDDDISIRMRALDLVVGMVTSDNLVSIVGRLMLQLRNTPIPQTEGSTSNQVNSVPAEPVTDFEIEEPDESPERTRKTSNKQSTLPDDYRASVILRILEMCSRDSYSNMLEFEWYIDVLVQLVRFAPATNTGVRGNSSDTSHDESLDHCDVSNEIGSELQNVAVRVKSVRPEATRAAESLVLVGQRNSIFPSSSNGGIGVLAPAAWIVGEYANYLATPRETLDSLLHFSTAMLSPDTLSIYLQAIPKVLASIIGEDYSWSPERRTMTSLLLARAIHFLEPLAIHPNLEVQERSVEFLELMRLAAEASSTQDSSREENQEAPLILTQAIPSLFVGLELNPVAAGAQRRVPCPDGLDLNTPINPNLPTLLQSSDADFAHDADHEEFDLFYNERPMASSVDEPAANKLVEPAAVSSSYQDLGKEGYLDEDILARRRAERHERNKDDPFYILNNDSVLGTSTPIHNILKNSNGEELNIDAIPIMQLDFGSKDLTRADTSAFIKPKTRKKVEIATDENIKIDNESSQIDFPEAPKDKAVDQFARRFKARKGLLQVDSSEISSFSLEETGGNFSSRPLDIQRQQEDEAEMAKALQEVERLRLEMQRASERIQVARGIPPEGTLVKKKKPKKQAIISEENDIIEAPLKKKKKKILDDLGAEQIKPKKKKKKKVDAGGEAENIMDGSK
ncbi:MAG: AP-3 complex subunit delta [Trizodia sp. TS-e1964]|nr:MAG: AP-3 complex subunit delta [Trizodia sp. TS-e1964]